MTKKIIVCLVILAAGLALGMGSAWAADSKTGEPAKKGDAKINKFKDGKLNLNAATKEDLAKIKELSPEVADEILKTREENGEFVDLEELLDIEGVDNKLLRILKKVIYLEKASDCNC